MRQKVHTPRFLRRLAAFVRHHPDLEGKDRTVVKRLVEADPSLRIHPLHGQLSGCFAVRITQSYRIVFAIESDTLIFIDIGSHDDVY